jgi:hypothetical protein
MSEPIEETVTLAQAKELIKCLAAEESVLLLSAPGVGKSDAVAQAAAEAGLPCRSLLGTQIAPEDVSGVPRIVGERSVFCPPRVLLPETDEPFCLFLDELPACTPDIQKAFYSLLLERRIGEHRLPRGSWVVAAGNRAVDRALVRTISSALVNRVILLNVRVDSTEWIVWAREHGVRPEVVKFIIDSPSSLMRPVPLEPVPFSTPRSWALLSDALDDLSRDAPSNGDSPFKLDARTTRAIAAGRISPEDARSFANWWTIQQTAREAPTGITYHQILHMSVSDLGLAQTTLNFLHAASISIVQELVVFNEKRLLAKCKELDHARVAEIADRLAAKGLWLGMDIDGTNRTFDDTDLE